MDNINLTSIIGNNFSGRSNYAKKLCYLKNKDKNGNAIYLGEIPSNFITGIAPTIKDEINLHSVNTSEQTKKSVNYLLTVFNFEEQFNKNPFTLSGGEQSILIILCALLLEPKLLAIDITLEQLNEKWRVPLLENLSNNKFPFTKILLIDNRSNEYNLPKIDHKTLTTQSTKEKHKYLFHIPKFDSNFNPINQSKKLRIENVTFSYNKKKNVLKNINFTLKSGNIYHLKGENGAGKTTLAKLLTGILKLKKGNIILDDKPINTYGFPGFFASYSFQNPDEQLFSITVADEVLKLKKNEQKEYTERRKVILKMFGLQEVENVHPAELPFVIRKRISLASTLALDKPWYIIDEPTLGQDNNYLVFLAQVFEHLKAKGKGIILISHSEHFISMFEHVTLNLNK